MCQEPPRGLRVARDRELPLLFWVSTDWVPSGDRLSFPFTHWAVAAGMVGRKDASRLGFWLWSCHGAGGVATIPTHLRAGASCFSALRCAWPSCAPLAASHTSYADSVPSSGGRRAGPSPAQGLAASQGRHRRPGTRPPRPPVSRQVRCHLPCCHPAATTQDPAVCGLLSPFCLTPVTASMALPPLVTGCFSGSVLG